MDGTFIMENSTEGGVNTGNINIASKYHFAEQQILGHFSGSHLARLHQIDTKRMSKFARIVRCGGILRISKGRPAKLDETSILALVRSWRENPDQSYQESKRIMAQEILHSRLRSSPFYIRADLLPSNKVSKGTYWKYMKIVKARLENEET